MTFNFVEKEFNIGGVGQVPPAFQFYKRGFVLSGSVSPTWRDVILSGNTALTLVNAKADGLNYVKLYGATENVPETYLDTVTLSGGCEQRNIPKEYTQVEYIESTGTQYIDTGVLHENLIVEYEALTTNTSNTSQIFLATSQSSNWVGWKSGKPFCGVEIDLDATQKRKYKVTYTTTTITLMDVETGLTSTTPNGALDDTLHLFAWDGRSFSSYTQLYSCKMSEGTTLVRNYIPCRRNSDSVLGMYDTVTGAFLARQGSGTFTAGADVTPTPTTPVDIVCNNGALKVSANLFDISALTRNAGHWVVVTTGNVETSSIYTCTDLIPVKPNTTYTKTNSSTGGIVYYGANGSYLGSGTGANTSFTTPADCYYVRYNVPNSLDYTQAMLVEGSTLPLSFVAYGLYIDGTTEIVTDNAGNTATADYLLKLDDIYKDTQEVLTGAITRNVGIKVFNGTENISLESSGFVYISAGVLPNMATVNAYAGYCTHAPMSSSTTAYGIRLGNNNTAVYWYQFSATTGLTTTAEVKAWMAEQYANGTPVVMIYPLVSATTETVSAQVLTKSPVAQTAGSINNLPIAYTESSHTTPKPTMPLDIRCNNGVLKVKNLYNGTTATITGTRYSYTQTATGFTATAQASTNTSSRVNLFCPISWFKSGETYTISGFGDYPTAVGKATPSDSTGAAAYKSKNVNKTFAVSSIDEGQQYVSIGIYFGAQAEGTTFSCQQIQLEQGDTVTSYLPYGQTYADGTTETVEVDTTGDTATATMLNGIGTYKDVQEVLTGGVTKNVGIAVFDGSENWQAVSGTSDYYWLQLTNATNLNPILSTHANNWKTNNLGRLMCMGMASVYSTLTAWKQFLSDQYSAGTPVIVIYPLATATTSSVTPQPLTIQEGTNIITAEGSVDNLPLEVSYKAGVAVTVTEVENANLDNSVTVTIGG